MLNLKSVAFAITELLAFNAQMFMGSRDYATQATPAFMVTLF